MSARSSRLAPPPTSYSPLSPSDPNNVLGKDNASSTRSSRSRAFSFKSTKGFKKVFGLLGKDSSGSEEVNTNQTRSFSNFRTSRRDSESVVATQNGTASPTPTPHNHGAQSRTGHEGGPFYRSRNARSMDALKLFTKSSKPPVPASKSHISNQHRQTSGGSMDAGTNIIIIRPNGGEDKDMPILRAGDDEADDTGNGSTSTESDRSTRPEGDFFTSPTGGGSRMSTSSGIGGPPPAGAMGAVHLPSPPLHTKSSTSPNAPTPKEPSSSPIEPPPTRSRPSKPSLSIPIPPRISHEKAVSESAALSSQSPVSITSTSVMTANSVHTPSHRKPPSSPGYSLRLTPSIVMSRPIWPLPPLPPMPTDIPTVPASLSGGSGPGSGLSWNMSNGKVLPLFRLSPPTRSMTGPTSSTGSPSDSTDNGASVRRSVSVKLNAMPSLNVMGETEVGDPEADDMMDEDEEDGEDDMDEEIPRGRPSIDSMMSIDSVASVETVRAPTLPPLILPPASRSNSQQVAVAGPIETPTNKGKGKAKKPRRLRDDNGDDGSASDSDESVYYDARGSVFLSPREVAQVLERRHSQISQRNRDSRLAPSTGSGVGVGRREGLQDISRDRRDSSWSFSTTGRESVYLTPSEGSTWSSAATPSTHGISTASDLAHSGFATEIASKRASVPVTFGATVGAAAAGSLGSRRGAANRFSMITAAELPNVDSSTLNFDASNFSTRTPTPGKGKGHIDGLPATRREGLPNFDSAVPATANEADSSDVATPKEVRTDDYFNTRKSYSSNSPSAHRRRGSISVTASVPSPISENAQAPTSPLSPPQSSIASSISPNRPSIINQSKRPSVYRQASRSMVDLSTSSDMLVDEDEADQKAGAGAISGPPILTSASPVQKTAAQDLSWLVPPPSPSTTRPPAHRQNTLRRVSSYPLLQSTDMPITLVDKPPPAYHSISRREEEGKETLPLYYNDIILAGLLPRKMEFDRPGLQARDRSWKKVWCVLQGTMLRVYKVGTLEVKFGALSSAPVAGTVPVNSSGSTMSGGRPRTSTFGASVVAGRRSSNATPLVLPNGTGSSEKAPLGSPGRPEVFLTRNQQNSNSPGLLAPPSAGLSASPASSSTWNSGSSHAPSRSSFSSSRPSTPSRPATAGSIPQSPVYGSTGLRLKEPEKPLGHGPGGRSVIDNGGFDIYTPASSSLMHQYTLQNGESGLATDYMKRRNVIRVRLEGEQFLLQLPGVEEVVEWIEGFQAATNIAMDLDVRPMPKGALYPRRRRRRRPRQPGEPATQSPLSPPPTISGSGSVTPRSSASQATSNSVPAS